MITRKRINNDIFIRWAIFKPDNTPEDFSNATIKYVRAKAKGMVVYMIWHTRLMVIY